MLYNESRNLLVQAFAKNHNAAQTAQDFSVSKWTVYRLRQQMERTGSVDLCVNQRGRKAKLTQQNIEAINDLIQKRPDITIREIDGVFAQSSYQEGTTTEKFLQYIRETLVSQLRPGDIVIMDNLSAHHTTAGSRTHSSGRSRSAILAAV